MSTSFTSRPAYGSRITLVIVAVLFGMALFASAPSKAHDNDESVACMVGMHNATWTPVPLDGNLVITANGSITSGRFSGHTATSQFVLANLADTLGNQCASPTGVTNASGIATLIVL
ncbi:hypothetical protein BJI69_20165 [Luteibacter rhizovicinus DSM 16549]|uniref:Uncharacterized protein n=1 Tax=Luteibacter rhizovicinus DSM 16549 TaxID=1440763 RepID=A0A0G9H394_9GAMM|nr:hypothetical protein [Luteibacter rhizovicinus]APG05988.1 hypothetical protein BJI69_20165 [Luteibacter rhizovicinus DSM 16549]KLD63976.1 hypothetical protein Y883_18500 [Luteibacter rhizovicinus DSM 16549]KLD73345.1 hypothetical protein Y886_38565 [Xanthomonas hyacinthi DSM 19077]